MFEAPDDLVDEQVLAIVREQWDASIDAVEHLAVGFGAYHWRADRAGAARLFVTYDRLGSRHSTESLSSAYNGAIALAAAGLEFVLAPIRAATGEVLVPVAGGALSCTPWIVCEVVGEGRLDDAATAGRNVADLARLHAADPPPGIPRWTTLVAPDLAQRLSDAATRPWHTGPYGEAARLAISDQLLAIGGWLDRYLGLVQRASDRPWVVTHGETHTRNQLRTTDGIQFVDWESLKLAPRERDLSTLVQAGLGDAVRADREMVELFDLEWRLAEIDQYAGWFAAPHNGTVNDRVAFGGLRDELTRPGWWRSASGG